LPEAAGKKRHAELGLIENGRALSLLCQGALSMTKVQPSSIIANPAGAYRRAMLRSCASMGT